MKTQIKIQVKERGDKEITGWYLDTFFQLGDEEYDARIYYDNEYGFNIEADGHLSQLLNQLKELDLQVWELCTEILDAEVSE